ncbi:hypothetical protein A9P82_07785 [Arachidicoccus ginsenosidimutans]|uniref:DUF4271 domain-containing protein n=1 Tax=Arachidicoccus sp. BS20 TaxID=1850526 RepID=UPI0007F12226|nr:DUF4271 domain-containing protein [Arachidicoccus sp. BS20]ANI89200.1 hypothetical protein A9P82_07785 [Arachidicoccus sp. BS20]
MWQLTNNKIKHIKKIFLILSLFIGLGLNAQTKDSAQKSVTTADSAKKDSPKHHIAVIPKNVSRNDSNVQKKDAASANVATVKDNNEKNISTESPSVTPVHHKNLLGKIFPQWFYKTGGKSSEADTINLHPQSDAPDLLFFIFLAIVLLVGVIRVGFPKYFTQVFQFILQPRIRKKNQRESNSAENVAPALLLNFLFVVTVSLCVVQLSEKDFSLIAAWKYWLYGAVAISIIYLVKYLVIKLSGWMFGEVQAASTYNYVVFSINKIVGVLLVPIVVFVAYGSPQVVSVIYSAFSVIVVCLLAYRYIASFILMRGNLKISAFHFFLYLCAIEIIPLLIVYKVLWLNFGKII